MQDLPQTSTVSCKGVTTTSATSVSNPLNEEVRKLHPLMILELYSLLCNLCNTLPPIFFKDNVPVVGQTPIHVSVEKQTEGVVEKVAEVVGEREQPPSESKVLLLFSY